ncbi:class I SAM-dependent methyltransferase [Streptomyces sp. 4N509B]|uniref:class I SAM-dependent methyltransferase n=1 Tax=Streptomyces sp. 4N509B TaxID=3457413 RepID=UPI003FD2872A
MTAHVWDYTALASTYADRPDYAENVVDEITARAGVGQGSRACDIGAGSGHLTLPLLQRGLLVDAVEPNDAMRALGRSRTGEWSTVNWLAATAQDTGLTTGTYALVTFGSSFNVAPPELTLPETHRLLVPGGWFSCVWNHRDLSDPLQSAIEQLIRRHVPGYDYGARRADQSEIIARSGLFTGTERIEGAVKHTVDTGSWCQAWWSHATLARQAGDRFATVVEAIVELVRSGSGAQLEVPYVTRGWIARAVESPVR